MLRILVLITITALGGGFSHAELAPAGTVLNVEKLTNGMAADTADGPMPVLPPGSPVTWTYRVSNDGALDLTDIELVDDVLGPISCPASRLPADSPVMICTAQGSAETLAFGPAHVVSGQCNGVADQPIYRNRVTATALDAFENPVSAAAVSHYCNELPTPLCDISLELTCVEPTPVAGDFDKCAGKLQQFTLRWPADQGPLSLTGGLSSDDVDGLIEPGQLVTFFNPNEENDVFVLSDQGSSKFHLSCSDEDMNDPGDCGKPQGDGKNDDPGHLDHWILAGFLDAEDRKLVCPGAMPSSDAGQDHCEIGPYQSVSCADRDKPSRLTFRYLGEGPVIDCTDNAASRENNKVPSCSGDLRSGDTVHVSLDEGTATPSTVAAGEEFDISGHRSNTSVSLSADERSELDVFHTSCSTAFEVGDRFGNLLLVAMDGDRAGATLTWLYTVSNQGSSPAYIDIVDDLLGEIVSGFILPATPPDNQHTFTRTVDITQTTGTATATAHLFETVPDDELEFDLCATDTASVTVREHPPCVVEEQSFSIDDDRIKWKVRNSNAATVTLASIAISAPEDYGEIKKIKLDGDLFKDEVRPTVWTFTEADFHPDVSRRQVKAGDEKTLVIEFTRKFKSAQRTDFAITLSFLEGCSLHL